MPNGTKVALFAFHNICRILRRPLDREAMVRKSTEHAEAIRIVLSHTLANKARHMGEIIIERAVPERFWS